MASIILITIGFIDYLVKWNKLTRVMFSSVVAGKKNEVFFPARKAQDVRWEVVNWKKCSSSPRVASVCQKTNLYLGQYWSHELVPVFNRVLYMLDDLIALTIFG
jgi:hypothetical protein